MGISATLIAVPHDPREPASQSEVQADGTSPQLSRILWLVLIAGALTQGSHGALNAFASIYWRSIGFSDEVIGYFWAVGVIAEILVFIYLGRHVGRSSGIGLVMIGSATAVIRFTIMSLQPGTEVMFMLQVMHSLTFAATHIGTMAALAALAPMTARGRAQGIYGSLAALTTAASTIVSGLIYAEAGAGVFAAMAPLGAIGFALMLAVVRLRKDQPQRAGSGG
jgi:PPP family 3-phenylpropionic acid transporter